MKHYCKLLFALSALCLTGCSDNGEPEEDLSCLRPDFTAPVDITVKVDKEMKLYKEIDSTRYDRNGVPLRMKTKAGDASWGMRYYVAAYRRNDTEPMLVSSSIVNPVRLDLPPDKYTFVGWADRVPFDDGKSHYFYTDDFNELLMRNKYEYEGNDPYKLAFHGVKKKVGVAYTSTRDSIDVKPAMGMFRLVANDSSVYTPKKVKITYSQPVPSSINGLTGKINGYWSGISYTDEVKRSSEPGFNNSLITADYVLSEAEETYVTVLVEIYDIEDNLRARVKNLRIPLVRGGITTVTGNFFSVFDFDKDNMGGGITIETEFDETIEIVI